MRAKYWRAYSADLKETGTTKHSGSKHVNDSVEVRRSSLHPYGKGKRQGEHKGADNSTKLFKRAPSSYWSNVANQRSLLENVAKRFGIKVLEDWYNMTKEDIGEHGSQYIVRLHNSSVYALLLYVYPNYAWEPWRFVLTPHNFWSDMTVQQTRMNAIGEQLNIKHLDEWYNISLKTMMKIEDSKGLISFYGGSLSKTLQTLYPKHEWMLSEFKAKPQYFWKDIKHQRSKFDEVGDKLNLKDLSDWYNVKYVTLLTMGCGSILTNNYSSTLSNCLAHLYPDYPWEIIKFKKTQKCWREPIHQKEFLSHISNTLAIDKPESWYLVSNDQIKKFGGAGLLKYWPHTLALFNTEFPWEWHRFRGTNKATQMYLDRQIKSLFKRLHAA